MCIIARPVDGPRDANSDGMLTTTSPLRHDQNGTVGYWKVIALSAAISKPFQALLPKTGREPTKGLSGKDQPLTKLKPSNVRRKLIPELI